MWRWFTRALLAAAVVVIGLVVLSFFIEPPATTETSAEARMPEPELTDTDSVESGKPLPPRVAELLKELPPISDEEDELSLEATIKETTVGCVSQPRYREYVSSGPEGRRHLITVGACRVLRAGQRVSITKDAPFDQLYGVTPTGQKQAYWTDRKLVQRRGL